MKGEKVIAAIANRIESEHRKHKTLDWATIAAVEIYNEFLANGNDVPMNIEHIHPKYLKGEPVFQLFQSEKSGEYYYRLLSPGGQNILRSWGHNWKKSCLNGIKSVKKNSQDSERYDRKEKGSRKWFNLKAGNGQVIGKSQLYESASGMENGIKGVMQYASSAEIKDLTL